MYYLTEFIKLSFLVRQFQGVFVITTIFAVVFSIIAIVIGRNVVRDIMVA